MKRRLISFTLMELLVALILLTVVVVAFSSIDTFSRFQLMTTDRRARLQNEVSVTLGAMQKEISAAVGNEQITGADSVVATTVSDQISFQIDSDSNGESDLWRAYRFDTASHQVWYCPGCSPNTALCSGCTPAWGDTANIISNRIVVFVPLKPSSPLADNFIDISVSACWDPATSDIADRPNGSSDNPCVTMNGRISMSAVSTQ